MKINWKVRIKNPMFLAQLLISIIAPVLTYFGLNWTDMTSWPMIGHLLMDAISNPVVVVAVVVSVFNTITDPTTTGLSDGKISINYQEPAENCINCKK